MTQEERRLLTLEEVAVRCGVESRFVHVLVEYGVIEMRKSSPPLFFQDVTLRVNKVVRLQRDLGVNVSGASVIVELLERIDELERELIALRRR